MFLKVKVHRVCNSHLQCTTSSKDSEKLKKCLYRRERLKVVVLGGSYNTASLVIITGALILLKWPQQVLPDTIVG